MRTIIYGDIHGCLEEFKSLREKLNIISTDREIVVGDLLSKGPLSSDTLIYARKNEIELVIGNHEYKYLRYHRNEALFKETGIKDSISFNEDKLSTYKSFSQKDMKYIEDAPFFIKIDKLSVVHAGITNDINLTNLRKKDLELVTTIREVDVKGYMLVSGQSSDDTRFWSEVYDGNQGVIVYGHNVVDKVKIDKYSFGIDTGCVYGKKLTALVVFDTSDPMNNYDIVQVDALREYAIKGK